MKKKYFNDRHLIILHDILIIPLAWLLAYWLRFNLEKIPAWALEQGIEYLPIVIFAQTCAFLSVGLYRSMWQYASLHDLLKILKAILLGCSFVLLSLFLIKNLKQFPRSIIPNYAIMLTILLCGARIAIRYLKEYRNKYLKKHKARVLVVGAGRAGEGLVRDMLRSENQTYKPVAFVDDKAGKRGQEIHGIRIYGSSDIIPELVGELAIEHIMLAIPSASGKSIQKILQICKETNLPISTLPSLQHIIEGQVSVSALRKLSIEDILGREMCSLDWTSIRADMSDQVILVSGSGGSIGSEVCRQIAQLKPKALIALDNSEYNLFSLEQEFKHKYPNIDLYLHLIDIRDRIGIDEILTRYKPGFIFHAAAYKHVPMLEGQIREAVYNNVLGTHRMVEAAIAHQVKKFVLVSTDKAVNPENIMGATKRIAEIICQNNNSFNETTRFITVRFGNVLDSAGSVVPIFRKQIEQGGPITVTHPKITRYFMAIPEAAQLILQAAVMGKGGEIFVLDMGEPIKVQFLAEQMIKLAGKRLGEDIEINYTGLRPGEKLFEELFHAGEVLQATHHRKILQARSREVQRDKLIEIIAALEKSCSTYNSTELANLIKKLVPELNSVSTGGMITTSTLPQI